MSWSEQVGGASDNSPRYEWVVHQCDNLTAYDNFNEDTFEGPTNVTNDTYTFATEDEAIRFYQERKSMLRFAGCKGMYYTYPMRRSL